MPSAPLWCAHIFSDIELPAASAELRLGVLRCLTLAAQIQYFCRAGYIPKQMWRMSQGELKRILQSPLFVREWQVLAQMFACDRAFCRFMARAQQADGKSDAAGAPADKACAPGASQDARPPAQSWWRKTGR